ncbi:MAG TPA: hypothetical protein PLP35_09080 [Caldisericia bacterium]|nr:hypothetical protein [Caldisericia bacterium]HPF49832.1 hypothetical protein [Caldisericia bacterium]
MPNLGVGSDFFVFIIKAWKHHRLWTFSSPANAGDLQKECPEFLWFAGFLVP